MSTTISLSLLQQPSVETGSQSKDSPPGDVQSGDSTRPLKSVDMPPMTSLENPNLSKFVHQHARDTPNAPLFLIPEQPPCPPSQQIPGKGWLTCTWAQFSDFIAELVIRFKADDLIGDAWDQPAPPVAALLISPAEDMLRALFHEQKHIAYLNCYVQPSLWP